MDMKDVKVVSFIPGRVRLKVSELKDSPEFADKAQRALETVPGIKTIDLNPLTGSVLLTYEPNEITKPESTKVLSETLSELFPSLNISKMMAWLGARPGQSGG
jgi:hypothetical protein